MKKINICFISFIILTTLFNCSKSTKSQIESHTAIVYIEQDGKNDNIYFDYTIFGDPITINFIDINNYKLIIDKYLSNNRLFGNCLILGDSINNQIDNLAITIDTDQGKLTGKIEKPDSVSISSIPSSISRGEDINISWIGDADFYRVIYTFKYIDDDGNFDYYSGTSAYLSKKSITISDDIFTHDGIIEHLMISPFNGPIPKDNSNGNISGNGGGFIYYFGHASYIESPIIVGDGIPTNNLEIEKIDTKEMTQKFRDELREKLMK